MFDRKTPASLKSKKTNYPLAIFLVVQAIFIISLAVSIPQLFSESRVNENDISAQPRVTIIDLSEDIPALLPDNVSHLQRSLFGAILDTESAADKSLTASIRSDTIITRYFETSNTNYFTAIIDVPELDLAYRVYYSYINPEKGEDPNDNIVILCADESDNCRNPYGKDDLKRLIYCLLKYVEFDKFTLNLTDTSFTDIGLNLASGADESSETYINEVKKYIESLGAPSDLFTYYIVQQNDLDYKIYRK